MNMLGLSTTYWYRILDRIFGIPITYWNSQQPNEILNNLLRFRQPIKIPINLLGFLSTY